MNLSGTWRFESTSKAQKIKNPILIAGLPGIGNVGKIVVDFLIEETKATKLYEISGHSMPNSVFVNENNLVELPKIEMYHKKLKNGKELFLLTGDVQPIDEESCYKFCEDLVAISQKHGVKEIITLGGIGLGEAPRKPKVYCTGNSKEMIARYAKNSSINTKVYGVVGPIVGVSGLLIGVAEKQKISAISLLAETLGHPMFLGVKGAKEILALLDKRFDMKLDTKKLDKEIAALDKEMRVSEELSSKARKAGSKDPEQNQSYIG